MCVLTSVGQIISRGQVSTMLKHFEISWKFFNVFDPNIDFLVLAVFDVEWRADHFIITSRSSEVVSTFKCPFKGLRAYHVTDNLKVKTTSDLGVIIKNDHNQKIDVRVNYNGRQKKWYFNYCPLGALKYAGRVWGSISKKILNISLKSSFSV